MEKRDRNKSDSAGTGKDLGVMLERVREMEKQAIVSRKQVKALEKAKASQLRALKALHEKKQENIKQSERARSEENMKAINGTSLKKKTSDKQEKKKGDKTPADKESSDSGGDDEDSGDDDPSDDDNVTDTMEMVGVCGHKLTRGNATLRVKWKGGKSKVKHTWEPISNLWLDIPQKVTEYLKKNKLTTKKGYRKPTIDGAQEMTMILDIHGEDGNKELDVGFDNGYRCWTAYDDAYNDDSTMVNNFMKTLK